jgi:hypothetical protein
MLFCPSLGPGAWAVSIPNISSLPTPSFPTNPYRLIPPFSSIGSLDGHKGIPDAGFVAVGRFFRRSFKGWRRIPGRVLLDSAKNPQTRFFAVRSLAPGARFDWMADTFKARLLAAFGG